MTEITDTILDQFAKVRASGKVNMLDRRGVQVVANEQEGYDLVEWISSNGRKHYGELLVAYSERELARQLIAD